MSARDMPFAVLKRKAEGMGYMWDGTEFRHAGLQLRVGPVSCHDGFFAALGATNWRKTFAKLVAKYNEARQTSAQGQAA